MHADYTMSIAGLIVGVIVGLTGMGGGALMTPVLVIFFNVNPSAAVSSDLVTSLFMKPVGGAIHWRRATVHRGIVVWLLTGAVPAAFAGVFVVNAMGGASAADRIKTVLGAALMLAIAAMVLRELVTRRSAPAEGDGLDLPVRPVLTLIVGLVGGLVVGMTSVGGGSIMIVALMYLYPRLSNRSLVGTGLVQAVPLVGSAAIAHIFFGDVQLGVTLWLLLGALPGVFIGAQISSRTTAPWLRPILAGVLLASALKLLDAPSVATAVAAVVLGLLLFGVRRWQDARGASVPEPWVAPPTGDTAPRAHLGKV